MRKALLVCMLILVSSSIAFGDWLIDFQATFGKSGIDKAVEDAMKLGTKPDLIVENGLKLQGLNPENLVKALYCAGAKGQDVRAASEKWNISEVIVAAGYKKSLAECGDKVVDSQPYTPAGNEPYFPPSPPPDPPPASPSTFGTFSTVK